jgi:hypothetical protein
MNERGVVLPTAMLMLVVLLALMVAFSALARTEPVIAENQLKTARARALAEAGVERAIWALATGAIPDSLGAQTAGTSADAPYNGVPFITLNSLGGFTVRVQSAGSAASNQRTVEAVGWTPTNDSSNPLPKGVRKLQTTLMRLRSPDPPCGLCVQGQLQMGGNAQVNAQAGGCSGATSTATGTLTTGTTTISGNAKVWGPGNDTYNERPADINASADATSFAFKLSDDEITNLKTIAQANGTYYQGSQSFDGGHPLPNGVIFVDTTDGSVFSSSTPDANRGSANIGGGFTWSGWLIVAGKISVSGTASLTGLVYAQNDLSIGGNAAITGAAVSENRKNTVATVVDSNATGTSSVVYDCARVRDGGGQIPTGWFVKAGTYRQVEGQ